MQRELVDWFSLAVYGIKKSYHWAMLFLIVALILMIGFVFPAFA